MIKASVIARTKEGAFDNQDNELFTFGGKMAGTCYMKDDYFSSGIHNTDAANKRAEVVCNSGHHSVFGHAYISIQLSGIPKIAAMILNSVETYNTSEKSARYTMMHPETATESILYDKWREIFKGEIRKKYSNIEEKGIEKLAIENARYMISVFTPTSMIWTVSYRELAYIINWLHRMGESDKPGKFNEKIRSICTELAEELEKVSYGYKHIYNNKDRDIEFMPTLIFNDTAPEKEIIGDVYQVNYLASFAELGQLQRHRSIHYEMYFSGEDAKEYGCYVPKIIRNTPLEEEWKRDFERVAFVFPQATLVKVLEQGRAIKFFEKAMERICGRAQLEIMDNTIETMQKFIGNKDKLSGRTLKVLERVAPNNKVCTKCMMKGIKCNEVCMWAGERALSREI